MITNRDCLFATEGKITIFNTRISIKKSTGVKTIDKVKVSNIVER